MDTRDGDEKELIELAFYRGHSHSELAEVTGMPLGTVKTKLRRALAKLREELEVSREDR